MSGVAAPRRAMRFRGRSYIAFELSPEPPIADWLSELDDWIRSSSSFLLDKPVVLDLANVSLSGAAVAHLIGEIESRGIRIMGVEGAKPDQLGPGLPPLLTGGRPATTNEPLDEPVDHAGNKPAAIAAAPQEPPFLLLDSPVRSGKSVIFPEGDVTVLGAVASGAEVVAGGSIHVYGALRGRALAGSNGNRRARIFCSRLEAELLAIDGYYRTAEDMDERLRNQRVQAWLDGEVIMMAALD